MTEDISEISENLLIKQQLDETVQKFPDAVSGNGYYNSLGFGSSNLFERKSLLGIRGSFQRLRSQYAWYHHEDNSMFRGIISGLTKRLQSLPYEIKSPEEDNSKWDDLIRFANFDNWENFISQFIINYSIYDTGAFVEIIAPGNPQKEPTGAATGIAVLDSRRCYPTGDPMYPVIYMSADGKQHIMHRSRIVQFLDMTERNEDLPGWGDSALSRCITPVFREILMAQYMRASLDDMPAPGFAIARNLTEQQVIQQMSKMNDRQDNDQDMLGRLVFFFGTNTDIEVSIDFVQFQKEFSGFDPDKLAAMNAKYMASGVGVDLQDFWELSGKGIGTATQSQVLAEKSKGRALGRLIKGIERMINDVFPDDVEFLFKYRNEEEDLERAQTAQAWATAIQMLEPYTTKDEQRIIATNQIPALKDAVTDDNGNIIRWEDTDPQSIEQATEQTLLPATQATEQAPDDNMVVGVEKDYRITASNFKRAFADVIQFIKSGAFSPAMASITLLEQLKRDGEAAYLDGLKRAGIKKPELGESGQTALSQWLSKQQPLVRSFVMDVGSGKYTDKELSNKGLQWSNGSLSDMLYKGMVDAAPRKLWRWVINPLKEHCVTCLRLNGQVHTMKAYADRGLLPNSVRLVCHGDFCGCKLVPDDGPARGRLASVRYVRRAFSGMIQ